MKECQSSQLSQLKYSVSRACIVPEPRPANFKLRAELKLLKLKSSGVLVGEIL